MTRYERCADCAFATRLVVNSGPSLCCWRYPPTLHRRWFRLVELYPAVLDDARCGEFRHAEVAELYRPKKAQP